MSDLTFDQSIDLIVGSDKQQDSKATLEQSVELLGSVKNMSNLTLEQLKQEHPSLYSECLAVGVNKERARAMSLLVGKARTHSERFAVKCIKEGTPFTQTIKAKHLVMSMKDSRNDNSSEKVVQLLEQRRGIKL